MADDKTIKGGRDRGLIATDEPYEVEYFAKEAGISIQEAKRLIRWNGNDRETLMREAKKLKAR